MTQQTAIEVLNDIGYEGFVKALYNRTGDLSKDFTHAVLGLVTEIDEYGHAVDMVHAKEEMGDIIFYMTALKIVLDDLSPTGDNAAFSKAMDELMASTNLASYSVSDQCVEWLDLAKRWIGYGKAPTMPTVELLAEASLLIFVAIEEGIGTDIPMPEVIVANVEKLMKRYNGLTFNAERAVNRDVAAERAVLEASAA